MRVIRCLGKNKRVRGDTGKHTCTHIMIWLVDTLHCKLCLDADSIADEVDDARDTYGSPMIDCARGRVSECWHTPPDLNRRDISLHRVPIFYITHTHMPVYGHPDDILPGLYVHDPAAVDGGDDGSSSNNSGGGSPTWWWVYPAAVQVGDWTQVILMCAWIWVVISAVLIGFVDRCYMAGVTSWAIIAITLVLLIPTCGSGPCKWIHGDWPAVLLMAAVIVVFFGVWIDSIDDNQRMHGYCLY